MTPFLIHVLPAQGNACPSVNSPVFGKAAAADGPPSLIFALRNHNRLLPVTPRGIPSVSPVNTALFTLIVAAVSCKVGLKNSGLHSIKRRMRHPAHQRLSCPFQPRWLVTPEIGRLSIYCAAVVYR
jgi:hypothetical protein